VKAFNKTTVGDIIWGYDHPLIKLGNDVLAADKKLPFNKFGFFVDVSESLLLSHLFQDLFFLSTICTFNCCYKKNRAAHFTPMYLQF
jgi:hypothetical protein